MAAARLLLRHGAERVLVSLDRDGAFLLDREGLPSGPCPGGGGAQLGGRRRCHAGVVHSGAAHRSAPGGDPAPGCGGGERGLSARMAPMRRPGRRPKLCCPGWGLTLPGTFRTDRAYTVPSGDSYPGKPFETGEDGAGHERIKKTNRSPAAASGAAGVSGYTDRGAHSPGESPAAGALLAALTRPWQAPGSRYCSAA